MLKCQVKHISCFESELVNSPREPAGTGICSTWSWGVHLKLNSDCFLRRKMSCAAAFFFFLMNEELFHQVTPIPQSSLAPTASRIKSKPFVLKSKAFHRLAPDSLINSVFPPHSTVNYQLQAVWLLLLPSLHTHTYCPSKGQRIAPLLSYVFGPFTWSTLAASHSSLNPMWNSRPVALGRSPWPSTPILTASSSAPSWHSVLVPLWWQLWVVINSPKCLWRDLVSLAWYSFALLPSCPSTLSWLPYKWLSICCLSLFARMTDYQAPSNRSKTEFLSFPVFPKDYGDQQVFTVVLISFCS